MKIIFCQDPMSAENPDSMYIDEVAAATHMGLDFELIDYTAIADYHNPARAVRDIPVHNNRELGIYRGWMLSATQYRALYDALMSRGIQLINNPQQYMYTHHLPASMPLIEPHTPHTIWMETDGKNLSYDAIMQMLLVFTGQALIVKDYVKSAKHYWHQACYISSASDPIAVRNTVERFLEIRGTNFEGGLVFREFVNFQPLAEHPASQMPLTKEYRIFFLNGAPIMTVRYWDVDGYQETDVPPLNLFAEITQKVKSRFFTMDIAQRTDGEWMIVELGDGQVAGLSKNSNPDLLYRALSGAR